MKKILRRYLFFEDDFEKEETLMYDLSDLFIDSTHFSISSRYQEKATTIVNPFMLSVETEFEYWIQDKQPFYREAVANEITILNQSLLDSYENLYSTLFLEIFDYYVIDDVLYYGPQYVLESDLRFQDEDDLIDDQLSALLPFIEENKDTQDVVSKDADEDVGVDYFLWHWPNEAIDDNFFDLDKDFSFLDFVAFSFVSNDLLVDIEEKEILKPKLPFLHYYNADFLSSRKNIISLFTKEAGPLWKLSLSLSDDEFSSEVDDLLETLSSQDEEQPRIKKSKKKPRKK